MRRAFFTATRAAALALAAALLALGAVPRTAAAQAGEGYVLIVNRSNPAAALGRAQVAKLFLKQVTRWPTGAPAEVVDLPERSPVRAEFTQAVLGKRMPAMNAYWQQLIFAGREIPPPQRRTSGEVAAFVAAAPGRVGYVAAGTALPAGVKVLKVE